MPRFLVAYEGRPTSDGRFIEVGALEPRNDKIPVTLYDADLTEYLGLAHKFKRSENSGALSFDITTAKDLSAYNPHITVSNIQQHWNEGHMITRGKIEEVIFDKRPNAWGIVPPPSNIVEMVF